MAEIRKQMTKNRIIGAIIVILLILTVVSWVSVKPTAYGSSNTELQAGEIHVGWFNAPTYDEDILRVSYDADLGLLEIYVVAQSSYNRTSGIIPDSFLYYHDGSSSSFSIEGPLPLLYMLVITEVTQWTYMQTWVYPSSARIAEMTAIPFTISLIAVTALYLLFNRKLIASTIKADKDT